MTDEERNQWTVTMGGELTLCPYTFYTYEEAFAFRCWSLDVSIALIRDEYDVPTEFFKVRGERAAVIPDNRPVNAKFQHGVLVAQYDDHCIAMNSHTFEKHDLGEITLDRVLIEAADQSPGPDWEQSAVFHQHTDETIH